MWSDRYKTPHMDELFGLRAQYHRWYDFTKAHLMTLGCSTEGWTQPFDNEIEQILTIEAEVNHDLKAFVMWSEYCLVDERAKALVHWGLTASDVVDSCLCLQMRQVLGVLYEQVGELCAALIRGLVVRSVGKRRIARTHGRQALLTQATGIVSRWGVGVAKAQGHIAQAREDLRIVRAGGSIGDFRYLGIDTARRIADAFNCELDVTYGQALDRGRLLCFYESLRRVAGACEKIAIDMRLMLMRDEANLGFGQSPSSSMPHKSNPSGLERICGLARTLRGITEPAWAMHDTWEERDLVHSSAERVMVETASRLASYIVDQTRLAVAAFDFKPPESIPGELGWQREALILRMTDGFSRSDAEKYARSGKRADARPGKRWWRRYGFKPT